MVYDDRGPTSKVKNTRLHWCGFCDLMKGGTKVDVVVVRPFVNL